MPLFENNLSPYLTIVEATEPAAPSAGQQRLYIDSTTHLLKATNSSGTDRNIEGGDLAGKELDYAEVTSNTSITATSGATANTYIDGASVAYNGSTIVLIEFFCPIAEPPNGQSMYAVLYDGSTELGYISRATSQAASTRWPMYGARRLTPSNASHTYHIKGFVDASTGTFFSGTGAAGAQMPSFMRITRVSS